MTTTALTALHLDDDMPSTHAPERLLAARRELAVPAFLATTTGTDLFAWQSDLREARNDLAAAGLL